MLPKPSPGRQATFAITAIAFSLTPAGVRPQLRLNSRPSLAGRGLSLREKRRSSRRPVPPRCAALRAGGCPRCPAVRSVPGCPPRPAPRVRSAAPPARPLQLSRWDGTAQPRPPARGSPGPAAPGGVTSSAPASAPTLPPGRGVARHPLRAGKREGESNPQSPWNGRRHFPVMPAVCPGARGAGAAAGSPGRGWPTPWRFQVSPPQGRPPSSVPWCLV